MVLRPTRVRGSPGGEVVDAVDDLVAGDVEEVGDGRPEGADVGVVEEGEEVGEFLTGLLDVAWGGDDRGVEALQG